jgi:RNA polymerase sigma-70 factor (ECF subfamily)
VPHNFDEQLIAFLPRMRVWALALTRNRAAAEDLTQDVAAKALVAQNCFAPGTNFSAWVHRIMLNHFISSMRNKREYSRARLQLRSFMLGEGANPARANPSAAGRPSLAA